MSVNVSPAAMPGQWLAFSPAGMAVITHVTGDQWEVEINFTSTPRISYHPSFDAAVQAIDDASDVVA